MTGILLVDDHPMVRQALRSVLGSEPGLKIVGEAADGMEAIQVTQQVRPNVILMDAYMPRMNGIESTRCIRALMPDTCIIGMSSASTASVESEFLSAGARAFLPKELAIDNLVQLIRHECSV